MHKYTLGFVWCRERECVLLLNRQKAPWMGRWNGVGGKLDPGESPLECITRETFEETGLEVRNYVSRGTLLWVRDGVDAGGVYLFTAEIGPEEVDAYATPRVHCHEGILDWKLVEWVVHADNVGVVDNVKAVFGRMLSGGALDVYKAAYRGERLESCGLISL